MSKIHKKYLVLILLGIIFLLSVQEARCSIVLKTMVVNPSRTKTQKATLKAYLPREAKPEDIVDLGDLRVDYDIEKGLYYVHRQVMLEPGESALRKVEIKDIWIVSERELGALSEQAKEFVKKLNNSNYYDTAVALSKDIDKRQADVIKTQNEAADALPQTHIAAYRSNMEKMDKMKANIAKLEKMLLDYKLATSGIASERVRVRVSWGIILAIIISLGLLSFAFFIIWHKQAGVLKPAGHEAEEDIVPGEDKSQGKSE